MSSRAASVEGQHSERRGVITVRFGYILEVVHNPDLPDVDPTVATKEVDVGRVDPEQLRKELQEWAVEQLTERKCDFGLYAAEFSSLYDSGESAYYLRQLYIVWSGKEVYATYVDDSRINFAGVRVLTQQSEAFERIGS
jgi:hypothetical protein